MLNSLTSTLFVIISAVNLSQAYADKAVVEKTPPVELNTFQSEPIKAPAAPNCGCSFADIVEPVIPAVVNIYTVQYGMKVDANSKRSFDRLPFEQLSELLENFNLPFNFDTMYTNPKSVPLGSGFIIDPAGFIVTNNHVIANVDEIYIKLPDDRELIAKLIGADKKTDLALLKIESDTPLPFVKFGDSSKARVGDWIVAIGNPFGRLGSTVTAGIISSKGRDIDNMNGGVDGFIQTDAAIHSGNSGGPMFSTNGEVIGVSSAILAPTGINIGIGFAIPSNTAKSIIEQLRVNGKISRGRLGVVIQEVTSEIAEGFGLKEAYGALVVEVQKDGPADKFGIKPRDVIIEFDGKRVVNSRKLQAMIAETSLDTEIKITAVRDGDNIELIGKIVDGGDTKSSQGSDNISVDSKNSIVKSNITFSNLTNELRRKFVIKDKVQGIIVTAIMKSEKSYGFKVGDLIIDANKQQIESVEQLNELYEDAKNAKKQNIILLAKRRGISLFIPLPVID